MMKLILLLMMLNALLGLTLFGSQKILSILIIIIAFLIILFNFILKNKMSKVVINIIKIVGILSVFCISFLVRIEKAENGVFALNDGIIKVHNLIEDEKFEKAFEEINKIETIYGNNDNINILKALTHIANNNTAEAKKYISNLSDKKTYDYYLLMENLYMVEKNLKDLNQLYIEAANYHLDWNYVQKKAGVAYLDNKDFNKAEYFLLRYYEREPKDSDTPYYLGVIAYETGRNHEALEFFAESMDRNVDDEFKSYIAWYVKKIKETGSDDYEN